MINNFEVKLASNLTLAISLTDAEKFHRDHEDIKPFVDVRYESFSRQINAFLLQRICERIDNLQRKTEKLSAVVSTTDPPAGPSELINTLISARQKVQLQFEDRLRLINAQIIFYKSSEQVKSSSISSGYHFSFLGLANVGYTRTRISNSRRYSREIENLH